MLSIARRKRHEARFRTHQLHPWTLPWTLFATITSALARGSELDLWGNTAIAWEAKF